MNFAPPSSPLQPRLSADEKARARDAAFNRFKHGSPKLSEVLRQKCRIRLKEKRNNHFLNRRNILNDDQSLIHTTIQESLEELIPDDVQKALIFNEMMEEAKEWDTEALANALEQNYVFCPICQVKTLVQESNWIVCNCGFRICGLDLPTFHDLLNLAVLEHELTCMCRTVFFTRGESLIATCPIACGFQKPIL